VFKQLAAQHTIEARVAEREAQRVPDNFRTDAPIDIHSYDPPPNQIPIRLAATPEIENTALEVTGETCNEIG
jgi:hypothetical protein